MAWEFSTDPEFQERLDWAEQFVRDEVEPLELAFPHQEFWSPSDHLREHLRNLRQQVKDAGLWACHLRPELGGQGYGQVKLALLNEILGRYAWGPVVFGTQAPDSGNAEILAEYGTDEQKRRYLDPLLEGEIFSSYSMTEPHGGSDPRAFTTRAVRDGDEWVINGEKYFSSNARSSAFLIVMVVTDPDTEPRDGMSMFLIPTDTSGVNIVRNIGLIGEPIGDGMHAWIRYEDVRVPAENLLGQEGGGFRVAQARLGPGRIHHAMRTLGRAKMALDMMCERALSRRTRGQQLSDLQLVQSDIADAWMQLTQFRLMVLYTAWLIDEAGSSSTARKEIAACKVLAAEVLHDLMLKSMHIHGALGMSNETPLARWWAFAPVMGVSDGPSEVHKVTVARQVLKAHRPSPDLFPSEWLPPKIAAARERFADILEHQVANS